MTRHLFRVLGVFLFVATIGIAVTATDVPSALRTTDVQRLYDDVMQEDGRAATVRLNVSLSEYRAGLSIVAALGAAIVAATFTQRRSRDQAAIA